MIFCTVTSNKHLFLAKVMAKSIKETNHDAKVVMCLVEEDFSYASQFLGPVGNSITTNSKREFPTQFQNDWENEYTEKNKYLGLFDNVVLAKDIGIPNFSKHMFKHHVGEGPASCKARLLEYVFNMYPEEDKFIYLDSDMKVYGPFDEINHILDNFPIVITPHLIKPIVQDFQPYPSILIPHSLWPEEIEFEQNKNGIYNSGFLALRRTEESIQFLNWWATNLEYMCYADYSKGLFGDQRWLDLAPVFFNVHILKHPGYNAAWWNHLERNISSFSGGHYLINGFPLRCFHFSLTLHLGNRYPEFLKERFPDLNDPIHYLLKKYFEELIQAGQKFEFDVPWSYNFFQSGELISVHSRLKYRNNLEKFSNIQNPFQLSNKFFDKEQLAIESRKHRKLLKNKNVPKSKKVRNRQHKSNLMNNFHRKKRIQNLKNLTNSKKIRIRQHNSNRNKRIQNFKNLSNSRKVRNRKHKSNLINYNKRKRMQNLKILRSFKKNFHN